MNAAGQIPDGDPSAIEALLPWHAAGTLNARDAKRVEDALARDPALARQFAVIRDELAETVILNESLGAPSARAMQKLFTAIDAEPARPYKAAKPGLMARFGDFVAGLSPRALAYSALAGAVLVVVQAGVIGTLVRGDNNFVTASFPVQTAPGTYGLIRFAPDASAEAITTLLGEYDASIVSGPQSGMFRVRFGRGVMSKADATAMLTRLKGARIVTFAEFAQ